VIKYFHELTEEYFNENIAGKLTYGEVAQDYPQPPWCTYVDAVYGTMGCWSLTFFMVHGRKHCRGRCEFYKDERKVKIENS
jgi:hypothetical protein